MPQISIKVCFVDSFSKGFGLSRNVELNLSYHFDSNIHGSTNLCFILTSKSFCKGTDGLLCVSRPGPRLGARETLDGPGVRK